jgi:ABC-type glycerol-3-phosphate transport system permease component
MARGASLDRMLWLRRVVLVMAVLLSTLPIIWTVLASFGVYPDNTISPPLWRFPPTLEYYAAIREEQTYFWQELIQNSLISATSMSLTLLISLCAAYALARSTFKYHSMAIQSLLVLASFPVIAYVIPLRYLNVRLSLHDTFIGIVLAQTALFAPLITFILHGYIAQLPVELEEEALLNGAGLRQLMQSVILPAIIPALIASAALVFALSWNQYFLPLLLTERHIRPLPVMMRDFFALEREFEWPKAAAVIVISLLPVITFIAAAHRALIGLRLVMTVD